MDSHHEEKRPSIPEEKPASRSNSLARRASKSKNSREDDVKVHSSKRGDSKSPSSQDKSKRVQGLKLGYWNFKGIAEPIRWLLAYLKLSYEEWNPSSNDDWFLDKKVHFEGDFPNLPYIQHQDILLSQSSAIPVFICNFAGKYDLLGKTYLDQAKVREVEGVLIDIRETVYKAIWSESPEAKVRDLLKSDSHTSKRFSQLSKYLGGKEFLLGYLTWADFQFAYMCEFLDSLTISFGEGCPSCKHANLSALAGRVRELDGVKQRVSATGDIHYFAPSFFSFKFFTFNEMVQKYKDMEEKPVSAH